MVMHHIQQGCLQSSLMNVQKTSPAHSLGKLHRRNLTVHSFSSISHLLMLILIVQLDDLVMQVLLRFLQLGHFFAVAVDYISQAQAY